MLTFYHDDKKSTDVVHDGEGVNDLSSLVKFRRRVLAQLLHLILMQRMQFFSNLLIRHKS